ncbi:MAG: hypothetical protein ACYCS4_01300 [Acidimicrobiales bacterium]
MSSSDEWSPDEPSETESFEAWDEALDEEDLGRAEDPDSPEGDRSLDTRLVVDAAELEEVGAVLDDPELLATLDGGMDDPDGSGGPDAV